MFDDMLLNGLTIVGDTGLFAVGRHTYRLVPADVLHKGDYVLLIVPGRDDRLFLLATILYRGGKHPLSIDGFAVDPKSVMGTLRYAGPRSKYA